jgi:hypothetical protein
MGIANRILTKLNRRKDVRIIKTTKNNFITGWVPEKSWFR